MTGVATVFTYMSVFMVVMTMTHGFVIQLEKDNSITLKDSREQGDAVKQRIPRFSQDISVEHYARHGLCKHFKGQKHFYNVMKSKLCQMKELFVANVVMDLCDKQSDELYKWVAELFDIDGNGFISYFEKNFYEYND